MDEPTDVTIRALGQVRVEGATALGPKQALLLGALALRGSRVSADVMIDLLWPDEVPDNPRAALQVHVSRLRRTLNEIGASVLFQGDGYGLVADRSQIDVRCFERLVQEGTARLGSDPTTAHKLLSDALSLWQGDPLDGVAYDTALKTDVQRLHDTHLTAARARSEADLALGRHDAVIIDMKQLAREHPMHEGFQRLLMLALYRSGRSAEALATFEEVRTLMAEALGADPSPELQELHRQILGQDPVLMSLQPASTRAPIPTRPVDPASIAVLPFEVIGGSDEAAILATGLHVDLLTELSKVKKLTVTSRHSVMRYDPVTSSPEHVAREVGVATVLVGSIRVVGTRFRLSVQLIDAAIGAHRWTESYDQECHPQNLLAVQHHLASDIAAALSRRLSPDAAMPTTDSMDAYRLVVEGRMQFDRRTEDGLAAAVQRFKRAVVVDHAYGLAWAGLASALAITAGYGYGDRPALLDAADSAVVRALALLPDNAEAHEALGLIALGRFDAPTALREYEAAIRLSPGNADAHSWKSWTYLTLGDAREGLASAQRAVALNPLSAEAVSHLSLGLIASGDAAAGLAEARRADQLSPGYTTVAYYAGLALHDLGRFEEAVEALIPLSLAAAGELTTPWAGMCPDAALAASQAAAGDEAGASATAASIEASVFPLEAGFAQAALGNMELAKLHFSKADHVGYGGALLRHHHFRDIWSRLDDGPDLDELDRRIARSWKVDPDAAKRTRVDTGAV